MTYMETLESHHNCATCFWFRRSKFKKRESPPTA